MIKWFYLIVPRFIDIQQFPDLYFHPPKTSNGPTAAKTTISDLVAILANRHLSNEEQGKARSFRRHKIVGPMYEQGSSYLLNNLPSESISFDSEFLDTMKKSLHPPHAIENGKIVPGAAFPFCKYGSREGDGILLREYSERYCNSFQTTFNEHGLCYTFNNVNQVGKTVLYV